MKSVVRNLAIVSFWLSTPAFGLDIIVPPNTSFTRLKMSPEEATYLHKFSGQQRLTGRFIAQWSLFEEEDSKGKMRKRPRLAVVFLPADQFIRGLPYFEGRSLVKEVWLLPTESAVRMLLPKADATALLERRKTRIEGNADLVIDTYAAEINCDRPAYSARIAKVNTPSVVQVASAAGLKVSNGC
jgi:hypothetical protein